MGSSASSGRRTQRLLLVLGGLVVVSLMAGGGYVTRKRQLDGRAQTARDEGLAAAARGDQEAALDGLGRFVQRMGSRGATAEDFLQLARARRAVELPNGRHLVVAMAYLRRSLELAPALREAQDELLDLYLLTGYVTEARELLDRLLAVTPESIRLLRIDADLAEAAHEYPGALAIARKVSALSGGEFDDWVRIMRLLTLSEASPATIDAWLDSLAGSHPGDVRVEILRAGALAQRLEPARANDVLDRAIDAVAPSEDPAAVRLLVDQLDRARRPDDALRVLERREDATSVVARRDLLRRLWYRGRTRDLLERAASWRAEGAPRDPELIALEALALISTERRAAAAALAVELTARTDPLGRAWNTLLAQALNEGRPDPKKSAMDLANAVATVPDNAVLLAAFGDASAAQGEWDASITAWDAAARRAPSWYRPLARLARAYLVTGRPELAVTAAHRAVQRAPTSLEAVCALIEVETATKGTAPVDELLAAVDRIEAELPATREPLLATRVSLLVRAGGQRAETAILSLLRSTLILEQETYLDLAGIAADAGLPLCVKLLDESERHHGVTSRLALARAVHAARATPAGGAASGLTLFDEMQAKRAATEPLKDWALARATYLDAVGNGDAGRAWVALADESPATLSVQLGALASRAMWSDRAALDRTIDRVRALTGESGVTWRIARARSLLTARSEASSDFAAAALLLTAVVRDAPGNLSARVLLAEAQERAGNLGLAEEHLQLAAALAPNNPWVALEQIRIAQRRGEGDAALRGLDRLLAGGDLSPEQSERAACLLAIQGDLPRSAGLLRRLLDDSQVRREGALLLAQLCASLGLRDEATRISETLLDRPSVAAIELAADLHASQGREAEAESVLERLGEIELRAGEREIVRARHAARWGRSEDARAWFRKAIAAAPESANAWTEFLVFAVDTGSPDAVLELIDDPRSAVSEPARFLAGMRDVAAASVADAGLRSLLIAALRDPSVRPPVTKALATIVRDWPDGARRPATASAVRAAANSSPRILALRMVAADLCAQTGQTHAACEMATSSMSAFPESALAAAHAAQILASNARWKLAYEAALAWRDRAGRLDSAPDLFLADILMRLGRPREAASGLEPHSAKAIQSPDDNASLLLAYVAALFRSDRQARAEEILRALAARSERWRTLPLAAARAWMANESEAVAWLRLCGALVPETDVTGRIRLAEAWGDAGDRFDSQPLIATARSVLAPVLARADVPAGALFVCGALAQRANDLAGARTAYEATLDRAPDFVLARNNLAIVLTDLGEYDLAIRHATTVTNAPPRTPVFLDTLAYACRKAGKLAQARSAISEAIRLDPANPQWRISLAETLHDGGELIAIVDVLSRVRELEALGAALSPQLRTRMERLRSR